MTNHTDQDALMLRYLLGTATNEEQMRLEERFFADDEQYQQLHALEDELRFEYAQGGLTPEQRKSFENRFVNSVQGRQRVDLAKSVLQKAYEVRKEAADLAPAPKDSANWWRSFSSIFAPQRFSFAGATAALVILSAGSWLMFDTLRFPNQLEQLQADNPELSTVTNPNLLSTAPSESKERAWVPTYDGLPLQITSTSQTPESESRLFSFLTKDATTKVLSYFEEQLKSAGFTVSRVKSANQGFVLRGEDNGRRRTVTVTVLTSATGTQASILSVEFR